ncbi:MAG: Methionyl-tRNA formyltransferase [Verrucomicrobiaceae bacterium]|nr:Methionyl-tRNA formyltransferase [Verrucomicrobiaceae bacterium]
MRILFLGTGDIGLPSLDWLLSTPKHQVVGVITQPDKPVGRKLVLTPPETKVRALAAGVPVFQPQRLRKSVDEVKAFDADIAVVIAYGQILSKAVLEAPRLGCINVHTSLLPKYRGAAPIQAAIREGDTETGATIMFMDEGLDTGDIILIEHLPIAPDETGGSLHDRLALAAPAALERALDMISAGNVVRTPQDNALATHVGKLTREDGAIDWNRSAVEIERLVRAYTPWPGTFTRLPDGSPLKVHATRVVPQGEACPVGGTIVSGNPRQGLIVACGEGLLEITEVQAEGRKRLPAADFLRGHLLAEGTRLL